MEDRETVNPPLRSNGLLGGVVVTSLQSRTVRKRMRRLQQQRDAAQQQYNATELQIQGYEKQLQQRCPHERTQWIMGSPYDSSEIQCIDCAATVSRPGKEHH